MSMQSAAEPQGSRHKQTQYVIARVLINKKPRRTNPCLSQQEKLDSVAHTGTPNII